MEILNWVNVNKRLPKDRQWVLIAHFEGSVKEAVFIEGGVKSTDGKGHRFETPYGEEIYNIDDAHPQITHWRPLASHL